MISPQISIEQNIVCNASRWLHIIRKVNLGCHGTAGTITAEKVFRSDLERLSDHFVDDSGQAALRLLLHIFE